MKTLRLLKHIIKSSRLGDSLLSAIQTRRRPEFQPYITELDLGGIQCQFFIGTPTAKAWYDPMKPASFMEYRWVHEHVRIKDQRVLDLGAHHGQYSVFFAKAGAKELCAVDPGVSNCDIQRVQHAINGTAAFVHCCAVAPRAGNVQFSSQSNGRIIARGGITVPCYPMVQIMTDAQVVKLDVEGAEYDVLPSAIDSMRHVHTWIIEVHPDGKPHPDKLLAPFLNTWTLTYFGRPTPTPYRVGTTWPSHATIIAQQTQP